MAAFCQCLDDFGRALKGLTATFLQGVSFVPLQGGCHANAVTVAGGGHAGPARTGTSTGGACADACTVTGSRQACEHPVCPGIRHAEFRGSDYYHATVVCSVVRSPNTFQSCAVACRLTMFMPMSSLLAKCMASFFGTI